MTVTYRSQASDYSGTWRGIRTVIILGIVLLIIGLLFHVAILWTLGIIALIIGVILAIAGGVGRAIGPRRHYY
jgi:uncharacterized membrane protein HdeD (DUF308 family)